jgi:uncharacterized protein (TIGR00251 family)
MKKVTVRIIPNARKTEVVEEESRLKVYVQAPAVDGKANAALIVLLAEHFKVKKGAVQILRGEKSREKIIGIEEA